MEIPSGVKSETPVFSLDAIMTNKELAPYVFRFADTKTKKPVDLLVSAQAYLLLQGFFVASNVQEYIASLTEQDKALIKAALQFSESVCSKEGSPCIPNALRSLLVNSRPDVLSKTQISDFLTTLLSVQPRSGTDAQGAAFNADAIHVAHTIQIEYEDKDGLEVIKLPDSVLTDIALNFVSNYMGGYLDITKTSDIDIPKSLQLLSVAMLTASSSSTFNVNPTSSTDVTLQVNDKISRFQVSASKLPEKLYMQLDDKTTIMSPSTIATLILNCLLNNNTTCSESVNTLGSIQFNTAEFKKLNESNKKYAINQLVEFFRLTNVTDSNNKYIKTIIQLNNTLNESSITQQPVDNTAPARDMAPVVVPQRQPELLPPVESKPVVISYDKAKEVVADISKYVKNVFSGLISQFSSKSATNASQAGGALHITPYLITAAKLRDEFEQLSAQTGGVPRHQQVQVMGALNNTVDHALSYTTSMSILGMLGMPSSHYASVQSQSLEAKIGALENIVGQLRA